MMMYDEPGVGRRRFSFVKIVVREAQALSIFGLESPIRGIPCYNAGYAVKENCRGRGLAIEAFNIGLEKLKIALRCENLNSFYVEAIIDEKNTSSLAVARKIFPGNGMPMEDGESGTPSLYFVKLIDC